jgi:metal-responsive CopG/Arc/MetJ family transcriptional regulator
VAVLVVTTVVDLVEYTEAFIRYQVFLMDCSVSLSQVVRYAFEKYFFFHQTKSTPAQSQRRYSGVSLYHEAITMTARLIGSQAGDRPTSITSLTVGPDHQVFFDTFLVK